MSSGQSYVIRPAARDDVAAATALVRRSASLGSLDEGTATLITKTLALSQLTAADAMTPRPRMHTLDAGASVAVVPEIAGGSVPHTST